VPSKTQLVKGGGRTSCPDYRVDSMSRIDGDPYILKFEEIGLSDIPKVGGKNASLGEMITQMSGAGIRVPNGFAVTAAAYRYYLAYNKLEDVIARTMEAHRKKELSLEETSREAVRAILDGEWPADLQEKLLTAYRELGRTRGVEEPDVAVRSSATAEDLPDASFAGQQESFLHVVGTQNLLYLCKRCFASLFTERAISYREQKGFAHQAIALSIGVQEMIRSDIGVSGTLFTLDTETGFPDLIMINAAYGLGENVVQGTVNPDEYHVYTPLLSAGKRPIIQKTLGSKEVRMVYDQGWGGRVKNTHTSFTDQHRFALTDDQILELARWAEKIAIHYKRPMDIEWALDGQNHNLYILQARPETVQSRGSKSVIKKAKLIVKDDAPLEVMIKGHPIGEGIAAGKAVVMKNVHDTRNFKPGDIIVTKETNPDWVPLMKVAGGLIADSGGRTSHAAIVSRELGLPAVIGTGNGTQSFSYGQEVTLCCEEGVGVVYRGIHPFEEQIIDIGVLATPRVPLMLNMASPEMAMHWWKLPSAGIGLARMEFIITNYLKVHPMAIAAFDGDEPPEFSVQIERLCPQFASPRQFFIETLSMGISTIAASVYPRPVIVRFSDFKTNEYANLIGGKAYEPIESNPMLGFRGASRYYDDDYRPGFELECAALKRAREELGFDNIILMIPFCRTLEEADRVLAVMAENGLRRGENGLQVYVMAEIPSNIILASDFADRFDGFSIGSNDLTQLVLGVDRDSDKLTHVFDERNPAVKSMIISLIAAAHAKGRKVGICGQAPSDYPDFAEFLLNAGIDSISLTPDSFVAACKNLS